MFSDLNSKCRTCLRDSSSYHQLFDYVEEDFKILEMLDCIVPQIDVKTTSQFSSLMCKICVEKLLTGFKFQQLCIETNNRLHELLRVSMVDNQTKLEKLLDPLTAESNLKLKEEIEDACFKSEMTANDLDEETQSGNDRFLENASGSDSDSSDREQIFRSLSPLNHHITTIHDKKQDVQRLKLNILEMKENDQFEIKSNIVVKEELEIFDTGIDNFSTDKGELENSGKQNASLYCEVCGKMFDRSFHLRRHHSTVHSLTRPHECEICKYRFPTIEKLKIHFLLHANNTGKYKCPDCPSNFNTKTSILHHLKKHSLLSSEKNYSCIICKRNFVSRRFFTEHITNKHPEVEKYKCDQCDEFFVLQAHFEDHLNRHRNLMCTMCKKEFGSKKTLKEHMRTHSGKNPGSASNISSHMEIYTGFKKYHCSECPSRFACRSSLIRHAITHSNAKPHVCDICGSRFTRTTSLQKHKLLHSGERPFQCDQCSMTFAVNYHLRRHMRTHTGEKPHKCKYCERAYAESGDLTKHLRTHVGENTYMCDQCPMAFKYQAELRQHQSQHYKMTQAMLQNKVSDDRHEISEPTKQDLQDLQKTQP